WRDLTGRSISSASWSTSPSEACSHETSRKRVVGHGPAGCSRDAVAVGCGRRGTGGASVDAGGCAFRRAGQPVVPGPRGAVVRWQPGAAAGPGGRFADPRAVHAKGAGQDGSTDAQLLVADDL